MAENEDSGKLTWFVVGAVVGAAVALLYAPKAGKDTRKLIGRKTDESKEAISGNISQHASETRTHCLKSERMQ